MNLFLLSWDVKELATFMGDQHILKIIIELTQMLYTAHWLNGFGPELLPEAYKVTHGQHPMSVWVREAPENYKFTAQVGLAIAEEYSLRFSTDKRPDKEHKCKARLSWLLSHPPFPKRELPVEEEDRPKKKRRVATPYFADKNLQYGVTPVPLCMPPKYFNPDPVVAYRSYYIGDKKAMLRYLHSDPPVWMAKDDSTSE